jgi:hypothetical protein
MALNSGSGQMSACGVSKLFAPANPIHPAATWIDSLLAQQAIHLENCALRYRPHSEYLPFLLQAFQKMLAGVLEFDT